MSNLRTNMGEIYSVTLAGQSEVSFVVGGYISRIEVTEVAGQEAYVPWLAIYVGNETQPRYMVNVAHVAVVEYRS